MIGHVANELRHHKFREDRMFVTMYLSSVKRKEINTVTDLGMHRPGQSASTVVDSLKNKNKFMQG